jgi:hypothetical protein
MHVPSLLCPEAVCIWYSPPTCAAHRARRSASPPGTAKGARPPTPPNVREPSGTGITLPAAQAAQREPRLRTCLQLNTVRTLTTLGIAVRPAVCAVYACLSAQQTSLGVFRCTFPSNAAGVASGRAPQPRRTRSPKAAPQSLGATPAQVRDSTLRSKSDVSQCENADCSWATAGARVALRGARRPQRTTSTQAGAAAHCGAYPATRPYFFQVSVLARPMCDRSSIISFAMCSRSDIMRSATCAQEKQAPSRCEPPGLTHSAFKSCSASFIHSAHLTRADFALSVCGSSNCRGRDHRRAAGVLPEGATTQLSCVPRASSRMQRTVYVLLLIPGDDTGPAVAVGVAADVCTATARFLLVCHGPYSGGDLPERHPTRPHLHTRQRHRSELNLHGRRQLSIVSQFSLFESGVG